MKKKNKKKIKFNYSEEYKTDKQDLTDKELKDIFTKKYFSYIMRKESRFFGGCQNDKNAL